MEDKQALTMIEDILKEGLKNKSCTDINVSVESAGELSVEFVLNNTSFYFYFG